MHVEPIFECEHCLDSGIRRMQEDDFSPKVFMRCDCPCGDRNVAPIPQWTKQCNQIFKPLDFNLKEWVPDGKRITFNHLVDMWKAKIKVSQEYWNERHKQA